MIGLVLAITVRVLLVHVDGPLAIDPPYAQQLFNEARAIHRTELGITWKQIGYKKILDRRPVYRNFKRSEERIRYYLRYVQRKGWNKSGKVYFIFPPLLEDLSQDKYFTTIAGIAFVCGPMGLSNAAVSIFGLFVEAENVIAIAHELGHLVNLGHDDDSCNIMTSNALSCPKPLHFTDKSKGEVRACFPMAAGRPLTPLR